jgi:hypothetical protein
MARFPPEGYEGHQGYVAIRREISRIIRPFVAPGAKNKEEELQRGLVNTAQ